VLRADIYAVAALAGAAVVVIGQQLHVPAIAATSLVRFFALGCAYWLFTVVGTSRIARRPEQATPSAPTSDDPENNRAGKP
jgi:hypothetical protein